MYNVITDSISDKTVAPLDTLLSCPEMNWSVIRPEQRLYKGKSIFKWDDSPGLGTNFELRP
jgi:hypothetical protein